MKLDYLLQFYWPKGLFYMNKHFICKTFIYTYLKSLHFFSFYHNNFFLLRLEKPMNGFFLKNPNITVPPLSLTHLNFLLVSFFPILTNPITVMRLKIVLFYLIKTTGGRSHALGKPVKAQRTWSNAWTSYYYNIFLRQFLSKYLNTKFTGTVKKKRKKKTTTKITPNKLRTKKNSLLVLWS